MTNNTCFTRFHLCSALAVLACVVGSPNLASAESADAAPSDSPTVAIINDEGPVGLEKPSDPITMCGDVKLGENKSKLVAEPGQGVVAALKKLPYDQTKPLLSKQKFGDCKVELEFVIAGGSNSGVKLQSRYEIQLYDSHGKENPGGADCGGVYPHWSYHTGKPGFQYTDKGSPPAVNAALPAGEWQKLEITFRAPRFDESGKKTENARFELVMLNGKEVQRDFELESPTGTIDNPLKEVAEAPLFLQVDHGAVAFRNVTVTPLEK
ncbi:3-keto-disaccharide hydrolase [Aeoliella mucimassa]|uniref:3-keto-alpha-glucoside-1,2-lyase/3-keto-2-hydroxy-glucal hydratase domain-containing protein n=1 Tax=Aeoliella mucimassa TaxID=2527972 RepID=A0A518AR02_9BACT|nr:DUF1080 domain-containing protein [Aeoliella mucimassa]QDU57148.1 hypothetical protein Pan181_33620 [Aeoliella mucimassa]